MKLVSLLILLSTAGLCGRPASDAPMTVGDARDGTLTADDVDETYGVVADAIPITYAGGDAVAVIVTSQAMDPFAIVALRGAPVGADAGQAGGAGACVILDAPHPLSVQVYVSSAGAAPHGDYHVSIEPASPTLIAEHGCQHGAPPEGAPGGPPAGRGETLTEVSHRAPTPARPRALTDS